MNDKGGFGGGWCGGLTGTNQGKACKGELNKQNPPHNSLPTQQKPNTPKPPLTIPGKKVENQLLVGEGGATKKKGKSQPKSKKRELCTQGNK